MRPLSSAWHARMQKQDWLETQDELKALRAELERLRKGP
jgi:hypothetical protein